jgi:D-alanyl-lipoteichoic acid acyltransferase DltB (MBOAT superfamily)
MSRRFLICTAVYILLARLIVRGLRGERRDLLFGLLNVAGFFCLFTEVWTGVAYVCLVLLCYTTMRLFAARQGWQAWVAFLTPIAVLIFIRYVFPSGYRAFRPQNAALNGIPEFIGISYLVFRNSYLVLQIRNGIAREPGLARYLGYSFFWPTMLVGPINPYSNFALAFSDEPPAIPQARAALRILVGLVKLQFLGSICDRLTYAGLLRDDHYHPAIDLPIAVVFYYLYLYCNFAGACDVAIGTAGLIGIPVAENFANPFAARSVRDFWNRWHITLSVYMRDVVFAPLSKFLVRLFGPANANHAIALTILVVFLLVGVWHGVGWNYAAFGAAHALGVAVNHYYSIGLKTWLGRDGFRAYNANPWIHGGAVVLTFCYVAATLFLFANTIPEMKDIFSVLKW